ncbi:MAG: STAS/SEC14 domain-containing protein [Pyrinomonadaceae bacterium]|nr:STAS/SEC14 domain-containing protein [Sphingobacteriaceae bacterium]
MLEIINDLPAHVLGVKATGEVDAADLKTILLPALEQQAESFDSINYLLVLDTSVKNFSAGAWFQDMMAGLKNFSKWNKIAVVTDETAVEKFTDLFSIAVPGKSKGFKHTELEEAKNWVASSN